MKENIERLEQRFRDVGTELMLVSVRSDIWLSTMVLAVVLCAGLNLEVFVIAGVVGFVGTAVLVRQMNVAKVREKLAEVRESLELLKAQGREDVSSAGKRSR